MAEEAAVETQLGETTDQVKSMEVETTTTTTQEADVEDSNGKREREEGDQNNGVEEASKKPKLEDVKPGPISLVPKTFGSSVEMFDYFYKFFHYWPVNVDVNQGYNGDKEKLGKCKQVSDLKNSLNVVNSAAEEVFSFVAVEYKTSKNSLNQVSLWDSIIPSKENAKFSIHTSNKYHFVDEVRIGGAYMAFTTREAFKGKFVSDL